MFPAGWKAVKPYLRGGESAQPDISPAHLQGGTRLPGRDPEEDHASSGRARLSRALDGSGAVARQSLALPKRS